MVVILGFAALTIDVGAIYNARGDLQRSADAAALAAAAMLSEFEQGDTVTLARQMAVSYVEKNPVLGKKVTVDPDDDVTFLRAHYNSTINQYSFTPTNVLPDAVRVTVRLSSDSPNGPLSLFFAGIFGRHATNVSASAIAAMVPRDIAIVADLSASHTDDSELRHYRSTAVNLWDVWAALPGGIDDVDSVWDPGQIPPHWVLGGAIPQAAGPGWGLMKKLGYGTLDIDSSYSPASDPGLVYLPYRENWTSGAMSAYLVQEGYSAGEVNAIMRTGSGDTTSSYPYRVAVALGLADWNSGMPGGRWSKVGEPAGNANTAITTSEVVWTETIMGRTPSESASLWLDYIRDYAMGTNNTMYSANPAFRYRYGAKTFVNYLLENQTEPGQTPELADVPTQPMQAVKDGIRYMMQGLLELDTPDQVALEVYSTIGVHEVDLTGDFERVSSRLNEMQAAHYGHYTNVGAGLERAIEELSSSRARSVSKKVIVLYTDGIANINASGRYDLGGARQYAWDMAREAVRRGFRIYAVSVGTEADRAFMDRIAKLGDGQHFHAEGSIEEYSAELTQIFNALSAQRSIALVQ
jgi:Flp pilus assembly protein TadG